MQRKQGGNSFPSGLSCLGVHVFYSSCCPCSFSFSLSLPLFPSLLPLPPSSFPHSPSTHPSFPFPVFDRFFFPTLPNTTLSSLTTFILKAETGRGRRMSLCRRYAPSGEKKAVTGEKEEDEFDSPLFAVPSP